MLLKYSAVVATCMVLLSTGCAALVSTPQLKPISTYNPAIDARIRVYQNARRRMELFPNQIPANVVKQNILFGPGLISTTAYKQLITHKMTNFAPYYDYSTFSGGALTHNYTVRSGQPLTISGYIVDTDSGYPDYMAYGDGCNVVFATFTPEAGYNYATYILDIGGENENCGYVQVVELKDEAGVVKEVPVSKVTRIELRKLAK